MSKDYCTGFFENWVRWVKPTWKGFRLSSLFVWEVFPLSELCEKHDEKCSTHMFASLLWEFKVVAGAPILTVATIACWVRYFKDMKERL